MNTNTDEMKAPGTEAAVQPAPAAGRKKERGRNRKGEAAGREPLARRFLQWLTMARTGSTGVRVTIQKRSRQLRHIRQILQAVIRILNALDKQTIYRK